MFLIVTCFMYPRVFTKEGSCGDCCLSCDSYILGLGPLKALIRPCVGPANLRPHPHLNYAIVCSSCKLCGLMLGVEKGGGAGSLSAVKYKAKFQDHNGF